MLHQSTDRLSTQPARAEPSMLFHLLPVQVYASNVQLDHSVLPTRLPEGVRRLHRPGQRDHKRTVLLEREQLRPQVSTTESTTITSRRCIASTAHPGHCHGHSPHSGHTGHHQCIVSGHVGDGTEQTASGQTKRIVGDHDSGSGLWRGDVDSKARRRRKWRRSFLVHEQQ